MIIYKITNTINGKVYIGQTTKSLRTRWSNHCNSRGCRILRRAIDKHGKENFIIEQIDSAETVDELNSKEIYWIQFYDSTDRNKGYNLQSGGDNFLHSEETKRKIGEKHKGKKLTEEHRKLLSEFRKNESEERKKKFYYCNIGVKRPCTEKRKQMLSAARKGVPRPKEVMKRVSETNKANARQNPLLGIYKDKRNGRYRVTIHRNYLGTFDTLEEAIKVKDNYIKELLDKEKNSEL